MNELSVGNIVCVGDMEFHSIEGGFGKDKKAMLVKEIAGIHNQPLGEINRRINENRKHFTDDKDVIDLKGTEFEVALTHNGIYTQNAVNRSTNIYILSERGYAKLLKIMDDDLAWEKYDQLVDGYFQMRKVVSSNEKLVSTVKANEVAARLKNAQARKASLYVKMANNNALSPKYKQVLLSYATKELNGGQAILPLPETKRGYSAGEIGKMFGLSANKIGRIANQHNLKVDGLGELRKDKSRSSSREVDTWVYFDEAIPMFEKVLNKKSV